MDSFTIKRNSIDHDFIITQSRGELLGFCFCISEKDLSSMFEEVQKFKEIEEEKILIKDREVRRLKFLLGAIYGRLKSIEDSLILGNVLERNVLKKEISNLNDKLKTEEDKC